MKRAASLVLAAFLSLSSCQAEKERDPTAEYRSLIESELDRWHRRYPAYSKAKRVEVDVQKSDSPTPQSVATASYESVVQGDVGKGRKMKLTYRFEVKHAFEDGKWTFDSGSAQAVAMEVTPSDEMTEAYKRDRLRQSPTAIESVSDADPAGALADGSRQSPGERP